MADKKELSTMGAAKEMLLAELGNETTQAELVKTVFKGLEIPVMKQAVLEGALRGFTFKDFLEKNVYAIPYGNGYSLVTSVDYNRKMGMKGGIVGTEIPLYEVEAQEDGSVKIISCTVTVKKLFEGGHIGEFSAQVFFDEYNTGQNQWSKKPRTMISKVAEMHALRKACPEELSQSYIEEEIGKDNVVTYVVDEPEADEKEVKATVKIIKKAKTLESLQEFYTTLGKPLNMVQDVIDAYEATKEKLSNS